MIAEARTRDRRIRFMRAPARVAGARAVRAVRRAVAGSGFIPGGAAERVESDCADYVGVAHCVGVASGTAGLELGRQTAGIGAETR